jgi:hypothetical protein
MGVGSQRGFPLCGVPGMSCTVCARPPTKEHWQHQNCSPFRADALPQRSKDPTRLKVARQLLRGSVGAILLPVTRLWLFETDN